jgi:hypothetical protein
MKWNFAKKEYNNGEIDEDGFMVVKRRQRNMANRSVSQLIWIPTSNLSSECQLGDVEGATRVTRTKSGLMKSNRALNKTKELK